MKLGSELLDREMRKARKEKPTEAEMARAAEALEPAQLRLRVSRARPRRDRPVRNSEGAVPGRGSALPSGAPTAFERLVDTVRGNGKGVRIQGLDNMMVRYSHCCQPVPGDEVIGYITRGRGISIHRVGLSERAEPVEHPERRVEIEWEAEQWRAFFVRLIVEGDDRRGLLSDIATAITRHRHQHRSPPRSMRSRAA